MVIPNLQVEKLRPKEMKGLAGLVSAAVTNSHRLTILEAPSPPPAGGAGSCHRLWGHLCPGIFQLTVLVALGWFVCLFSGTGT
jgi:hypothetical protein